MRGEEGAGKGQRERAPRPGQPQNSPSLGGLCLSSLSDVVLSPCTLVPSRLQEELPGLNTGEGGVTSGKAELWAVPRDAGNVSKSSSSVRYGSALCWDHVFLAIPAPCPLWGQTPSFTWQGSWFG